MKRYDAPGDWMWADALAALDRMDRLHRQFFQPLHGPTPSWEPPVDVVETAQEVLIYVALPGVDASNVKTVLDGAVLTVSGHRTLPPALATATIHRLELPQGHFERRLQLPPGHYTAAHVENQCGCLVIHMRKAS